MAVGPAPAAAVECEPAVRIGGSRH
jgi:hypothetical protein